MNNFFRTIIYLFLYIYSYKIGYIFYNHLCSEQPTLEYINYITIIILCISLNIFIIFDITKRMK